MTTALRNYTRWTQSGAQLHADILGTGHDIRVNPDDKAIYLNGNPLSPDEARLIGVRLIDAAVLADGDRAIRAQAVTA